MLGRHEVDVVAAVVLQAEHHAGELVRGELVGPSGRLRGLPVLAEHAAEVAEAEEDRPAAAVAAQHVLLPEVGKRGGDHRVAPGVAHPSLVGEPVHATVAGARSTVPQLGECRVDLVLKPSLAPGPQVDGLGVCVGGRAVHLAILLGVPGPLRWAFAGAGTFFVILVDPETQRG